MTYRVTIVIPYERRFNGIGLETPELVEETESLEDVQTFIQKNREDCLDDFDNVEVIKFETIDAAKLIGK